MFYGVSLQRIERSEVTTYLSFDQSASQALHHIISDFYVLSKYMALISNDNKN